MAPIKYILLMAFHLNVSSITAQVGINTANPKAALDIESSNYGVVMPRLALTSTQNESPASNPQGEIFLLERLFIIRLRLITAVTTFHPGFTFGPELLQPKTQSRYRCCSFPKQGHLRRWNGSYRA